MHRVVRFFTIGLMVLAPTFASAGLFDDLNKMKNELDSVAKKLQGGTLNIESTTQQPASPQVNPSNDVQVQSSQSAGTTASNVKSIASGNKTLNFICKPLSTKSVYAKLGKPNIQVLVKDFGKSEAEIALMLSKSVRPSAPYLISLEQYVMAFDSDEAKQLFSNFVKMPNVRDLAIMATTKDKGGFDKKKKIVANDARFAYGLIHKYYESVGANGALGEKLLKEAAKKDQYGARFIEGLRWARGYGRNANLTNAASWMRPTFEKSQQRDGDLAQIIENEFLSIVLNPAYENRDLYVDLINSAAEIQQDVQQQLRQNTGNGSVAALFREDVYKLTVTRGQLLIDLAEVSNAGVNLERYKAVFAELANQANPSIATLSELIVVTDNFQNSLSNQLNTLEKIEASTLPKIKSLYNRTEIYVADAHSLAGVYAVSILASGNFDVVNNDSIELMSEIGVMRVKACSVREGIINYASRSNVELTPTNVAVGTNVLAPKKKKKR